MKLYFAFSQKNNSPITAWVEKPFFIALSFFRQPETHLHVSHANLKKVYGGIHQP
ncbi:hypothetical protein [Alysiella filiformis]|uniref:hypothetical protein n=1 Tax=Alysiella filiformis TaxID=194196 RepID=UPI0015CBF0DC|nr:hypothetical protein [Alysiella filiformis]QMT31194.1 hypothetical protein H3L97_10865 [Alysiella filiformis]UBQ55811.1 hypothetical protein JF568_09605 [Alysiella filiformis DSM 16848]